MPSNATKTKTLQGAADDQTLRDYLEGPLYTCFGPAGLAKGTNAHTIKTANSVNYTINGVFKGKGATDNIAMTACLLQAISTWCLYLVSLDAADAATVTKGEDASTDTAVRPDLPANNCPIGLIKVATDATHTFTSGTTDLSAAGITATYQDVSTINYKEA
jgi:hypothetical protein